MRVQLFGTRGSLPTPGPSTARYGGNTSCVQVTTGEGQLLVLDAGSGIRELGNGIGPDVRRVDILLTHLHMDHIQGLGFFRPLYDPAMEVHIWGPTSTNLTLHQRLSRYLSPPLFPVLLVDLPCDLHLHEVPCDEVHIEALRVDTALVCHPGPTVGYRISNGSAVVTYIPDHEPALGNPHFPHSKEWTSGYDLAEGADLLIHDSQYTTGEYPSHTGWGHSSVEDTLRFGKLCGVKHLVPFHHDPGRDDDALDRVIATAVQSETPSFQVTAAAEGDVFQLRECFMLASGCVPASPAARPDGPRRSPAPEPPRPSACGRHRPEGPGCRSAGRRQTQ